MANCWIKPIYWKWTKLDWNYKYCMSTNLQSTKKYRMNTDGLKTADNWQATGVEEWPKLDFFFSLVDLHIVLYCINALYFRHSLWWLCTRYFLHCVFYLIFCILWTVLYLCIVHWTFSVMTLQNVFRALCIYIFCSQFFSHILYLYFCIVYLIFLRWVCTSYFIYWTLYFVFFTLLHSVFVQCALHISAFSAVSLRIKIDLLPRPSLSSQAAHHNLRAKTSFIKIQIRRISSKYIYGIYEQECSKYWNWR